MGGGLGESVVGKYDFNENPVVYWHQQQQRHPELYFLTQNRAYLCPLASVYIQHKVLFCITMYTIFES